MFINIINSNQETTNSEELLLALQRFYHALSVSVCDPVAVSYESSHSLLPKIFYDAAKDTAWAQQVMQSRIHQESETITKFMKQHTNMYKYLVSIKESANMRKKDVIKGTRSFIEVYRMHIDLINEMHKHRHIEDTFLDFPHHQVMGPSNKYMRNMVFNQDSSYHGALEEAETLDNILNIDDEKIGFGEINATGTSYSGNRPATKIIPQYPRKIEFVKTLLEKAGFNTSP